MKPLPFLLALLLLPLAGCQSTEEYLATFHGLDRAQLLGRLGQPEAKEPDGRGGEVWIYQEKRVSTPVAKETEKVEQKLTDDKQAKTTTREKQVSVQNPVVRMFFKSFYLDANGVVYDTAHGSRYLQR
jgi:hypothetical protein